MYYLYSLSVLYLSLASIHDLEATWTTSPYFNSIDLVVMKLFLVAILGLSVAIKKHIMKLVTGLFN